MQATAARALKCDLSTICRMLTVHPEIEVAIRDEWELALDTAELKLFEAIDKGEAWAVCLFPKTQGKARGYIGRSEYTGADGRLRPPLVAPQR